MKLLTAALLMAVILSGCGYKPSTAECFRFAPTDGPCTFTPVTSEHREAAYNGD